jgi:hypothetical protein
VDCVTPSGAENLASGVDVCEESMGWATNVLLGVAREEWAGDAEPSLLSARIDPTTGLLTDPDVVALYVYSSELDEGRNCGNLNEPACSGSYDGLSAFDEWTLDSTGVLDSLPNDNNPMYMVVTPASVLRGGNAASFVPEGVPDGRAVYTADYTEHGTWTYIDGVTGEVWGSQEM